MTTMAESIPTPDFSDATAAEPPAPLPPVPPPPVPVADGIEHPLDPRAVKVDRIAGWLVAGPLLAVVGVLSLVFFQASIPGWIKVLLVVLGVAMALGLAWSAHRWPAIAHRHASYRVDERGMEIRRGVNWRKVINVPRSRVQHTDVSQGPLQRRHGLATLVIYTAGTTYAKVELAGLDHATALRIREHLLAGEGGDAV
jgi:membrane protein YdbS with pleckstrin-like domain